MASFQKRGKTWQYTVSNKGDPIRKSGFRTKAEAKAAATEVESQLNNGTYVKQIDISFDDYFESWLKTYKTNITKNTMARYKNTLKTIKEVFKGKTIQSIDRRFYQKVINDYGKNRKRETVRKFNYHIRSSVKDAIDEGLIRIDFTRNIKLSGLDGKSKEEKYLNYDESLKLLDLIYKRLNTSRTYYLILLALMSGMRFGEIVGLTTSDFDFVNNTININKTWGHTKNMHSGWGPTKTQVNRVIKMNQKTMDLFNDMFKSLDSNPYDLVFFSDLSKYKVISNAAANKVLKSMISELGIQEITIHNLRHTHVSILLYKGVSIYYISKRLGHSDLETTLNVYTHMIKELEEKEEAKSMEALDTLIV